MQFDPSMPTKAPEYFVTDKCPARLCVNNANELSEQELKRFYGSLMTKEQTKDQQNFYEHGVHIYSHKKVSLGDVRYLVSVIGDAMNVRYGNYRYHNCRMGRSYVIGYGITKPAMDMLQEYIQKGYDISFIDLSQP